MRARYYDAANTIAALPSDPRLWDDGEVASFQSSHGTLNGELAYATPKQKAKIPQRAKPEPWTWDKGREAALQRAGGLCEARTEWCETLVTQVHHIAGRDWKGCHHPDLLLAVCGEGNVTGCHGWIHGHTDEAKVHGWMRNRDEARRFYGTKPVAGTRAEMNA